MCNVGKSREMTDEFEQGEVLNERPVRKRMRWLAHDYSGGGTYFVTTCTHQREPVLDMPALRTIVQQTWEALPQRYPQVVLDEFVIMPDHIHFILHIQPIENVTLDLPDVVGAFKSLTSVRWHQHMKKEKGYGDGRFWQRSYYDHIIRSQRELENIRLYIVNNPLRWEEKYTTRDWNI